VWALFIIVRHLRHRKKYAWAPLPVGEHRIQKFQSVPDIQGAAAFAAPRGLRYKMRAAVRVLMSWPWS